MVARPGRIQTAFTAGELAPLVQARIELKYFGTGCAYAENVRFIPQGGFTVRDGLLKVGELSSSAAQLLAFTASTGAAYDIVFDVANFQVWTASAMAAEVAHPYDADQVGRINQAQQLNTMLLFHVDVSPRRIKLIGGVWSIDEAPLTHIPTFDYGGTYVNGVAAVWSLQFIGFDADSVFFLTVSGHDTQTIINPGDNAGLAAAIQAAILQLPNVKPGVTCVYNSGDDTFDITFAGTGNEGDGWAVSGKVQNKPDAAVLAYKTTVGVEPGEDLISVARGWPRCGAFVQQRLIMGGFKALPAAWLASSVGDYYNFDERLDEADGAFLVQMDAPGGEAVERIVASRNTLIFTTQAEYWLADRLISKTTPPNHVQASRNGIRPGTPIVENEGAALYVTGGGSVISEFRYTDVEGNFVSTGISILAAHLFENVADQAVKRARSATEGNLLAFVQGDGAMRLGTLLREQEVTAFARVATDGTFISVSCNGRNEMMALAARPVGTGTRRALERFTPGLLLDAAIVQSFDPPQAIIPNLSAHNAREVWAIGDDDVFGPFLVKGGAITLPRACASVTVGRWRPPVVTTLPLSREIGARTVLQRKARIHSVWLDLIDTTSVAVAVNGGAPFDLPLRRFGDQANVPELSTGFTGLLPVRGLTGFADDPQATITQVRPGRLTVRRIILEAAL